MLATILVVVIGPSLIASPLSAIAIEPSIPEGGGLIFNPSDAYNYALTEQEINELKAEMNNDGISLASDFVPSSVDLSQDAAFPPIANQEEFGSCTTFATTYYQFTYMVNKKLNNTVTSQSQAFSPKWIYNSLNGGDYRNGTSFGSVTSADASAILSAS